MNLILNHSSFISPHGWVFAFPLFLGLTLYFINHIIFWEVMGYKQNTYLSIVKLWISVMLGYAISFNQLHGLRSYYCLKYLKEKWSLLCFNFVSVILSFWNPLWLALSFFKLFSLLSWLFGFAHWVNPEAEAFASFPFVCLLKSISLLSALTHLCVGNIIPPPILFSHLPPHIWWFQI